jgi:hypothetical protein
MDELINAVSGMFGIEGVTLDDIHSAIIAKGWSKEDAFLAIKAGENLYNAKLLQEKELAKQPPPFGRKL